MAAPDLISWWTPWDCALVTGPGTPIRGRLRRSAQFAVLSAPLRRAASTTTVPRVRAAIRRLRARNRRRVGAHPGAASDTIAPVSPMCASTGATLTSATWTVISSVSDLVPAPSSVTLTLWNGVPLYVAPPNHVELKIVETDPGVRGDTATGGQKPAKLETGATVRVPLFINEGEVIRVDTRTRAYVSRVKQ